MSKGIRPITPEQEAGLDPVGWSWEQHGGMLNCFPYKTSWDYGCDEKNAYWVARGFTMPRPMFFQTPIQASAGELLDALVAIIGACDACAGSDDKSLVDEFTDEMEQRARALIAKLRGVE